MRRLLLISVITLIAIAARGQIISPSPSEVIDTDSVRKAFDNSPFFGLYMDNYFIFGPSVGPKATKANTNVKFQISIRSTELVPGQPELHRETLSQKTNQPIKNQTKPGVVVHAFNPSTWEAEAGGFLSSRSAWSTE